MRFETALSDAPGVDEAQPAHARASEQLRHVRAHATHTQDHHACTLHSSLAGIAQVGAVARELLCQQLGLLGALVLGCRHVVCALRWRQER